MYYVLRMAPMWANMKAIANSLPYDSAIMGDFSLPTILLASLTLPTLVLGGTKSPALLRQAVQAVGMPLPQGQARQLDGQSHNVSVRALAPILTEYFAPPLNATARVAIG